jgi:transcription elongation factor Elf1
MENKFTCPICGSHAGFKLMADYSASGLWCSTCGVSFGDPGESFPNLPSGLVDLIEVWVGYWDAFSDVKKKWNFDYHHALYCRAGEYISELVNKYYPCAFRDYDTYLDSI